MTNEVIYTIITMTITSSYLTTALQFRRNPDGARVGFFVWIWLHTVRRHMGICFRGPVRYVALIRPGTRKKIHIVYRKMAFLWGEQNAYASADYLQQSQINARMEQWERSLPYLSHRMICRTNHKRTALTSDAQCEYVCEGRPSVWKDDRILYTDFAHRAPLCGEFPYLQRQEVEEENHLSAKNCLTCESPESYWIHPNLPIRLDRICSRK